MPLWSSQTSEARYTLTPQELEQKGAKYWHARCRRMVRPPEDLKGALKAVLDKYRNARDPELCTQYTDQVYEAVVQLIDSGRFCGEHLSCFQQCVLQAKCKVHQQEAMWSIGVSLSCLR
jgi:hypothetical protein